MATTHCSLHYHTIFSTKNRIPGITKIWRNRLHQYIGGIITNLGGVSEAIGGTADHIHLLLNLNPTHCLADVVRDIKSISSRWIHDDIGQTEIHWQDGYGAFTVGPRDRDPVIAYISHQEEHHLHKTFQEEYLDLLNRAGIKFDERYLW